MMTNVHDCVSTLLDYSWQIFNDDTKTENDKQYRLKELLKPMVYKGDITNLLTRFLPGSRGWVLTLYDEWHMASNESSSHRAFIIYGTPGIGKVLFYFLTCMDYFRILTYVYILRH